MSAGSVKSCKNIVPWRFAHSLDHLIGGYASQGPRLARPGAASARIPTLSRYSGFVADSGEGRWTIMAAIEEAVPANALSAALFARFRSREEHTFADKLL